MNPVSQEWEYTDEFKEELDKRYNYYISGSSMISAEDARKQIQELVQAIKECPLLSS